MITGEDGLINYLFYRTVKSLYFINKIGYYYISNNKSISTAKFSDIKLRSIFYNIKLIFEYSKNNKYEKDMANAYIYKFLLNKENNQLKQIINNDCEFYNEIIKIYLDCEFISIENKIKLKNIKC